jgi:membrane protease YdiL (CAAX protease family)
MHSLRALVGGHPIASFVVLAYALSWTLVPFGGLLGSGPFLAALLVLWAMHDRSGITDLLRRMVQWRVAWGWYAAAVLLPAGLAILAGVLTLGLGAERPSRAELSDWTEIPLMVLLFLLIPLLGPWEEPGFRGFALSRLRERHTFLSAALLVGVIHVGFHVPLMIMGDIPVSDVVFVLAASIPFAWLVVGSGGSIFVAMLMHAVNNVVSGEYVSPMFSGYDGDLLGWVRASLWCIVAVVLVAVVGRDFGGAVKETPQAKPSPHEPAPTPN